MKKNIFKKIRLSKSNKKSNKQIYESFPLNTDNVKNSFKKKSKKKCFNIKKKYIYCLIITVVVTILISLIILFPNLKEKISDQKYDYITKPFLPLNKEEVPVKEYHKTKYDSSKLRFHYEELFKNRTIFTINYSYRPYTKLTKSLSFDENAKTIFEDTGMLNMTLLNSYYYGNVTYKNKLNHIHVCMGMDKKVVLLSLMSMVSLFKNSSPDTFIHFHILLVNCDYEDIQIIYSLNYINKNVEFVFYNAKQTVYDFSRGKKEGRGVGDYTRVLAPEIVNNTNRIIILDSGDIFVNRDISELYYFDMGDNYFVFSLEDGAGIFKKYLIFARNNFYPNTGVCLVNVRKFREDNLYYNAFFTAIAYKDLPCPYQDIFLVISNFKFKFWPLNYNCPQFFENDEQLRERKNDTVWIKDFMNIQVNSPFKYTVDEIIDAAADPVINHLYHTKPHLNNANKNFMDRFREYANMTGFIEEIKKKYPKPFKGF